MPRLTSAYDCSAQPDHRGRLPPRPPSHGRVVVGRQRPAGFRTELVPGRRRRPPPWPEPTCPGVPGKLQEPRLRRRTGPDLRPAMLVMDSRPARDVGPLDITRTRHLGAAPCETVRTRVLRIQPAWP